MALSRPQQPSSTADSSTTSSTANTHSNPTSTAPRDVRQPQMTESHTQSVATHTTADMASSSVEMDDLPQRTRGNTAAPDDIDPPLSVPGHGSHAPSRPSASSVTATASEAVSTHPLQPSAAVVQSSRGDAGVQTSAAEHGEQNSDVTHVEAAASAVAAAVAASSSSVPPPREHGGSGSTLQITLLLTSGARHGYRIDENYLQRRNIQAPGNDPFSISVYTLKELILREWRDEWDVQPSSPTSIRLIHFGRLLDDKARLRECRFSFDVPNVVHMTVRPQDVVDEEEASGNKMASKQAFGGSGRRGSGTADRDGLERSPGCRCIIL